MIVRINKNEYRVLKRVLDESYLSGVGVKLGTAALMLAMALGVHKCKGEAANQALEDINTPMGTGTTLFQDYNAQNWAGTYSTENTRAKALFAAIVTYAQEHHVGIAEAAKTMKGELFAGYKYNTNLISKLGNRSRISSVVTTTDGEEEIVVVTFRYVSSVDKDGNATYVTSQIIIPSDAAPTHSNTK